MTEQGPVEGIPEQNPIGEITVNPPIPKEVELFQLLQSLYGKPILLVVLLASMSNEEAIGLAGFIQENDLDNKRRSP